MLEGEILTSLRYSKTPKNCDSATYMKPEKYYHLCQEFSHALPAIEKGSMQSLQGLCHEIIRLLIQKRNLHFCI